MWPINLSVVLAYITCLMLYVNYVRLYNIGGVDVTGATLRCWAAFQGSGGISVSVQTFILRKDHSGIT